MDENERQERADRNRADVERIVAETDAMIEQSRKLVSAVYIGRRAQDRSNNADHQDHGEQPDQPRQVVRHDSAC